MSRAHPFQFRNRLWLYSLSRKLHTIESQFRRERREVCPLCRFRHEQRKPHVVCFVTTFPHATIKKPPRFRGGLLKQQPKLR